MGILQEFKPSGRETLSKLSKNDLEDFKMLLNKYKMSYRDKLNIPDEASFGCEIECEGISLEKMEKYLDTYIEKYSYDIDTDGSLGKLGLEVKTPILHNTFEDFEIFRAVLTLLQRKTYITTDCGGHIHIGAHILGDNKKSMINFLKLWEAYEPVIYRFGYGEYLNERLAATFTCNGYANPFYGNIREMIDSVKNTPVRRYRADLARRLYGSSPYSDAISFQTIKSFNKEIEDNTIQFRSPNASLNPVIWQNNINFFIHLLTYAKSLEYDTRVINKRIEIGYPEHISFLKGRLNGCFSSEASYIVNFRKLDFDVALELSDLIFDKNIDKINFLKQYSKNFEVVSDKCMLGELKRAKKMTR